MTKKFQNRWVSQISYMYRYNHRNHYNSTLIDRCLHQRREWRWRWRWNGFVYFVHTLSRSRISEVEGSTLRRDLLNLYDNVPFKSHTQEVSRGGSIQKKFVRRRRSRSLAEWSLSISYLGFSSQVNERNR